MNAGQSSFKWIRALRVLVLMPLAIIVVIALAFAFYEAHKAYWDYRVDQLCAQDGGVKIREVAYLDPKQYE